MQSSGNPLALVNSLKRAFGRIGEETTEFSPRALGSELEGTSAMPPAALPARGGGGRHPPRAGEAPAGPGNGSSMSRREGWVLWELPSPGGFSRLSSREELCFYVLWI